MKTVFCLSGARSGTKFLSDLVRRNTRDVVCRHEPYGRNPSMFGRPIYDHAVGDQFGVRRLLEPKRRVIESYGPDAAYMETSHAFLKSWYDLAPEFFPGLQVVHLVRNPLEVARSELHRLEFGLWRRPIRVVGPRGDEDASVVPRMTLDIPRSGAYRGGDQRLFFRWGLTGLEPIFSSFDPANLTAYQWFLVQWIEIENRAARFLAPPERRAACFTLESPSSLTDAGTVEQLFDFLDFRRSQRELRLKGDKNHTPGKQTNVGDDERRQLDAVLERVAPAYLEIFAQEPYTRWSWSELLR